MDRRIALALVLASMPSLASAQEVRIAGPLAGQPARIRRGPDYRVFSSVEITTGLALADAGRAGPGLLPYGYDHETGPMGTLDVRAMAALNRLVHVGGMARFAHMAGDSFGASSHGFLHLLFEAGVVGRWALWMGTDAGWQAYIVTHLGLSGSVDARSRACLAMVATGAHTTLTSQLEASFELISRGSHRTQTDATSCRGCASAQAARRSTKPGWRGSSSTRSAAQSGSGP